MTHDLSDIIEVMVFQHLVGVSLDIAPLFETLGDLEAAPGILNQMFDYEPYRKHLESRHKHQQIMLGYSDSNKDCGYLTANWALFQAQETISDVCKKRGLGLTLFHGRGGSIARGGGPAAKAILAQPCGCYDAKIRVTEQGEVLSTRYHDPDLAFRIIEQMAYGVLLGAEAAQKEAQVPEAVARGDDRDVAAGLPGLRSARPQGPGVHRVLEHRHADRGDQRPQARLASHLPHAPPNRSRICARFRGSSPGCRAASFFPAGTDSAARSSNSPPRAPSRRNFCARCTRNGCSSRRRSTTRNSRCSRPTCRSRFITRSLVPDEAIRVRIFDIIAEEFSRTEHAILAITGQKALLEREPVLAKSVQLRNPYIDPLNYIQVEMIRRLRGMEDKTSAEADALRAVIELTINGVSGGLKNTG